MANEFKHLTVGNELSRTEYESVDAHEADSQVSDDMLYYNGTNWIRATPSTIRGLLEHDIVFHVNAFQYPNPGTDWTPELVGAGLGANLAAKKVWLPLNFLKVGDIITMYNLLGDIHEEGGDTVTLDCKLVEIGLADPLTATDVVNGGMTQQDTDGDFDVNVNCDDTTVATDKQYVLEIEGSTSNVSANEKIEVMGAEVTITRKI